MGVVCRNTSFSNTIFELSSMVPTTLRYCEFVDTCNRLDITNMEAYVMLLLILTDSAMLQFESVSRSGGTAQFGDNE